MNGPSPSDTIGVPPARAASSGAWKFTQPGVASRTGDSTTKESSRDRSLDTLLDLDGQTLVVDREGRYWVRFSARLVPPTPEKPHGLDYALTLHGPDGARLVGFDNAHPVRPTRGPGGRRKARHDHRHRHRTVQPYDYRGAAALLEDFWAEVEFALTDRGVKS